MTANQRSFGMKNFITRKDGLISNLRFHDKNDVYVIQDYPAITYIPDFLLFM